MAVFLPSVPILSYFTKKSRNSVEELRLYAMQIVEA